jgi:mono/diheme cytochrome c family protein
MNRKLILLGFSVFMLLGLKPPVRAAQSSQASKTVWDGVYTAAQAMSGQAVYTEHCTACHSQNLGGGANQGAPPLKGDKFMENWREDRLESLFTKIRTTMPRRDPKSLTDAETIELVAYIMQANEFPVGSELTAGALGSIQIQRQDGPEPLPNYALVQVVGCMMEDGDYWNLTSASAPLRIRSSEKSTPEELKVSTGMPLGTMTFRLQNLRLLGAFDPAIHKGHKMMAKGSFTRQGTTDRISVTELEMVGSSCGGT